MDRSMASSLPTKKLDRTNYASWSYKMHQYLLGHGYWSYVEGANDAAPESTHRDFPAWEQSTSMILYCFASCVGEHLLSYVLGNMSLWMEPDGRCREPAHHRTGPDRYRLIGRTEM